MYRYSGGIHLPTHYWSVELRFSSSLSCLGNKGGRGREKEEPVGRVKR